MGPQPQAERLTVAVEQASAKSSDSSSDFVQDGSLDYKGRPARKSTTGGWKACFFVLGNDVTERVSYYGVSSNLVTYLTEVMGEGLAVAAENVNNWSGCVFLSSIPGAFLADAFWGRYKTIAVFGSVNLIGIVMLVCAVTVNWLRPTSLANSSIPCTTPTGGRRAAFFYLSLYVMAVGSGVMKPCISSLGAAQFDQEDEREAPLRDSFFNWWFTMIAVGIVLSVTVVVYIQDFVGWGWGYGIPAVAFAIALAIFLAGTTFYRYQPLEESSPFTQILQVAVAAVRKWRVTVPKDPQLLHEVPGRQYLSPHRRQMLHTDSLTFLDKAATIGRDEDRSNPWMLSTVTQVEEVKLLAGTFPIWMCQVVYLVTYTQMNTLFTKQGSTLDNRLGPSFRIPPASFQVLAQGTVMLGLPLYDRFFVPLARKFTGNPRGISLLQRFGIGFAFSCLSMVCAALTERHRLEYLRAHGLLGSSPRSKLPLSIFRLVPQYVTMGASEVFAIVAGFDFFYDQTPDHMHTVGGALNLSALGIASFLSTGLIALTSRVTRRNGQQPWVGTNINSSRVDNFFWFLAVVDFVNVVAFVFLASRYRYKKAQTSVNSPGNVHLAEQDDNMSLYSADIIKIKPAEATRVNI